jgi:dTDP-4-amino-4,6-dideoxygalactose transaminase
MQRQAPCAVLRRDPRGLAQTEAHAAHCLSIPCHPQLDDDAVGRVIDAINTWR